MVNAAHIIVATLALSSCGTPAPSSPPRVVATSRLGITEPQAVRMAKRELQKRGLPLPAGARVSVEEDYQTAGTRPPRAAWTIRFHLGRPVYPCIYSLSIARDSGELLNLIDVSRDLVLH